MTLGNRISALRAAKKYSQEYLVEKLDVSRQAVSKWENDISSPDTKNLISLAELFGVSLHRIILWSIYKAPASDVSISVVWNFCLGCCPEHIYCTFYNRMDLSLGNSQLFG